LNKSTEEKLGGLKFEASPDQLKLCFDLLDEKNGEKEYLNSFDEECFFKQNHVLHAHRLAKHLPSKAALELEKSFYNTVLMIGPSGCGKSHVIYLNALKKMCIYLTPNSWVLSEFFKLCVRNRAEFDFQAEVTFRFSVQDSYLKYILARCIVLLYLKQEMRFCTNIFVRTF
jgi:hypothetical protein